MESSDLLSRTFTFTMTCGKTFRSAISASRFSAAGDKVENDERGEQAVACSSSAETGCGRIARRQGPRRASASLEDVAVADGRAQHANAAAFERSFESHVRHGGGDHETAGKHTARFEIARCDEQDCVAIDDVALRTGKHAAVGIAVECEADRRAACLDFICNVVRMQRAAAGIDVLAVGSDVQQCDMGVARWIAALEKFRSNGGCGSIGAVGDDIETVKRKAGKGIEEELNVVGLEGEVVGDGREAVGIGDVDLRSMMEDFFFDGEFIGIGQLESVGAKELYAVILQGLCEAEMTTPALKP